MALKVIFTVIFFFGRFKFFTEIFSKNLQIYISCYCYFCCHYLSQQKFQLIKNKKKKQAEFTVERL